jgi:hypothetical protein
LTSHLTPVATNATIDKAVSMNPAQSCTDIVKQL